MLILLQFNIIVKDIGKAQTVNNTGDKMLIIWYRKRKVKKANA